MRRTWSFQQHSHIAAAPHEVWNRVVTPEGINDEMRPWMTMSVPRGARGVPIDHLQVGRPVGRVWLRLAGVIPFDFDHLVLTLIEPGRRFREESTMLSMRQWIHDRTVDTGPGGRTRVTDVVTFRPRLGLRPIGPIMRHVLAAFFRHRHRRLAAHFSTRVGPNG